MGTVAPPPPPIPVTPNTPVSKKSSMAKVITLILLIILILFFVGAFSYSYFLQQQQLFSVGNIINNITRQQKSAPTDIPIEPTATSLPITTPTPIPLHAGSATYNGSQSKHDGPDIRSVTFDPLDVQKDQKFIITIGTKSTTPVTSVTAVLQMDNSSKSLTFTNIGSSSGQVKWQNEFILPDTVWYKYILTITATDASGTNKVTVAPRS